MIYEHNVSPVAGPTIDGKAETMFRGVLQRGESRAGAEEKEDQDVAAEELVPDENRPNKTLRNLDS